MSDKAKVFIKYDVDVERFGTTKRCKGIISNMYRGFDPIGMVTRNQVGLLHFLRNLKSLYFIEPWDDTYHRFRRMFDVDFYRTWMDVSEDMLEYAIKRFFVEGNTSWEFNDLVQCVDTDFGEFYVDISGRALDELVIKYSYYVYRNSEWVLMDAREYINNYIGSFEENERTGIKEVLNNFDKMIDEFNIELMTKADLEKLWNTDYMEFLEEYIPQ